MMILSNKGFVDCNQATLKIFNVSSVEEFIKLKPWDVSPEKQPDGKNSMEKAKEMLMSNPFLERGETCELGVHEVFPMPEM